MTRFAALLKRWPARARGEEEAAAVLRVKAWVRAVLACGDDTAFAVNEIACTDPACPGVETVVLIMEPGRRTRACKVAKAIETVTEQDIRDALR